MFTILFINVVTILITFLESWQYAITNEEGILQHAIEQLKKIPLKEQRGPQERLHLKSLQSKVGRGEGFQDSSFLYSFLSPIQKWADKKLGDYHLHYSEVWLTASAFKY